MLPRQAPHRVEMSETNLPWVPSEFHVSDYINAYFSSYHMQYPIIHEPTFRAQFQEMMVKPPACR